MLVVASAAETCDRLAHLRCEDAALFGGAVNIRECCSVDRDCLCAIKKTVAAAVKNFGTEIPCLRDAVCP